ncbi:hypothetical protein [Allorhizocola rhizosphaerae]|uniref:hypothetical protein n=1 Tax=Allorhizocola rhizosphaerae TaxID=1872709 RepID=UPI000E3D1A01|nr:hypothetical protein [Allorhizocola rhizosphaerae]
MRHLGSLLIALVFAPSVFLLTGTGLSAFASALDDNKAVDPLGAIAAFGALLLAGVLYGILVMARLSPLGPGLAGLAGVGLSGWAMFDIDGYKAAFSPLDVHMGDAVGQWGLGILLGVPLIGTLFSPRRWRREDPQPVPPPPPPAPTHRPVYYPPVHDRSWMVPDPDVPAPSLRYPQANAESPIVPVVSAPPADADPLPQRVPSPPPPEMLPVSDDDTLRIGVLDEPPTAKIEQDRKDRKDN